MAAAEVQMAPWWLPTILRDMLETGGHTVQTEAAGRIVARSVIQLDGDLLTLIAAEHLEDAALLRQHFSRVGEAVTELALAGRRLGELLKQLGWAGLAAELVPIGQRLLGDGAAPFSLWELAPAALGGLALLARKGFGGWLRRRLGV